MQPLNCFLSTEALTPRQFKVHIKTAPKQLKQPKNSFKKAKNSSKTAGNHWKSWSTPLFGDETSGASRGSNGCHPLSACSQRLRSPSVAAGPSLHVFSTSLTEPYILHTYHIIYNNVSYKYKNNPRAVNGTREIDVFDVLSVLRITPFPAFYSVSGRGCWANLARFHGDSQ